jgi:hypothetical protein
LIFDRKADSGKKGLQGPIRSNIQTLMEGQEVFQMVVLSKMNNGKKTKIERMDMILPVKMMN